MLSVKVIGEKELVDKLKKLSAGKIQDAVYVALREITDTIADDAKRRCPVETGALRDSITPRTFKDDNGVNSYVYCEYPNTERKASFKGQKRLYYAMAVEYGNRHAIAQPFLKPALRANKKRALALVLNALGEATK